MLDSQSFAAQHYDFFRFSMLTVDLLLTPHELSIPYDVLLDVVYEYYNLVPEFDESLHESPYEQAVDYIRNTPAYLEALRAAPF